MPTSMGKNRETGGSGELVPEEADDGCFFQQFFLGEFHFALLVLPSCITVAKMWAVY